VTAPAGGGAAAGRRPGRALRRRLTPPRALILAFAAIVLTVTVLLLLPLALAPGQDPSLRVALFTATSSICSALPLVDTSSHWSLFGELVILASMQVGGLGFMTLASLLGLVVFRRLGLRTRVLAATQAQLVGLADVRRVVLGVAKASFAVEGAVGLALWLRLWLAYDEGPGRAAYSAVFHSVSAFTNAGFSLYSDNLIRFVADPWVCVPIIAAMIFGGLGFPVLFELRRELFTPRLWSLHTKITMFATLVLTVGGAAVLTGLEWHNEATFGPLSLPAKLLAGVFASVTPRTTGYNTVDYGQAEEASLVVTEVLMFIGGGSASTAGGIKVTTFFLLFFAILAEARGDDRVDAFGRQIPSAVLRQSLAVALVGVALVVSGTLAVLAISGQPLSPVLFEVTSAFGTVGLSTGITGDLPPAAHYVLAGLIFLGRVGPITLASALALRSRTRLYRYPEERPLVG
jgi:trk system potassium uptake protein TrkH